jgi:hypothetical protein
MMWEIANPKPVKLIIGILAADQTCLAAAVEAVRAKFGPLDLESPVWPFTQTEYYKEQAGASISRQFVTVEKLIDPGNLAEIKLTTNRIEQELSQQLALDLPRPVNLDPGTLEPSKLVLASTKNFSHRIYIGQNIYAELTLSFIKGSWQSYSYTFSDYKGPNYHPFLTKAREKLVSQLRAGR